MKKYKVILHPDAETDINSSYEWGCRVWGEKRAKAWVRELRHTIRSRLTSMPLGCALTPESEELDVPIKHLIAGRYRILFTIERQKVTILHVRGPYVSKLQSSRAVDE